MWVQVWQSGLLLESSALENGWCVSEHTALSGFYFLVCSAFDALGIPLPIAVCLWKGRECQHLGYSVQVLVGFFTCSWRRQNRVSFQNNEPFVWSEMPVRDEKTQDPGVCVTGAEIRPPPPSVSGAGSASQGRLGIHRNPVDQVITLSLS